MPQCGESAFVPPPPAEQPEETPEELQKEPISLRISVFFDGTGNNRANIDQRTGKERQGEENLGAKNKTQYKLAVKQSPGKPKMGQSQEAAGTASASFEADYSNIALLEENFKATSEFTHYKAFYIEGVGTQDLRAVSKKYEEQLQLYDAQIKLQQQSGVAYDGSAYLSAPKLELDSDVVGFAFAAGSTGIYAKMDSALAQIGNWYSDFIKSEGIEKEEHYVEKIVVDVFGFSRGAATARAFIHYILEGKKTIIGYNKTRRGRRPIYSQLPVPKLEKRLKDIGNIDIAKEKDTIEIGFVGIFDTVSSYHYALSSDVKALNLDAIKDARKVYHLAAADEHRICFSLTDISSAKKSGVGEEYFLPGVHSDIGGGYRAEGEEIEDITLLKHNSLGMLALNFFSMDMDYQTYAEMLVKEGWFKCGSHLTDKLDPKNPNHQIQLEKRTGYDSEGFSHQTYEYQHALQAYRNNIKNSYRKIPMNLMADAAEKNDFSFSFEFRKSNKIPSYLQTVDSAIKKYISDTGKKSEAAHWHPPQKPSFDINKLRNEYLHYSAHLGTGHWPLAKPKKR